MATKTDTKRLSEIRDQIANLRDEESKLDQRPVDKQTALDALDRWIDKQAAQFDPSINGLLKGKASTRLEEPGFTGASTATPAICAIMPEAVRDWFAQRITDELTARDPIPPEQAKERKAEIDQERLRLEQEEEQIIQRMRARGEQVERRGDADVRAVLGLETAPQRPAPQGGSAETPSPAMGRSKMPYGEKV